MPDAQAASPVANYWIAGGSAVFAVSPFLTWIDVPFFGSLDLFQIFRIAHDPTGLIWLAISLAAGLGIASLARMPGICVITIVLGSVLGLAGGWLSISAIGAVNDAGLAQAIGPWVALGGIAVMLTASIVGVATDRGT